MDPNLGTFLAQARLAAGYAQQAEFAAELGVKQQTVSRWERGLSRLRSEQVPEIAAALGIEADALRLAAGYTAPSPPQLSLDRPWPVDALPPETFERLRRLKALHDPANHFRFNANIPPAGL